MSLIKKLLKSVSSLFGKGKKRRAPRRKTRRKAPQKTRRKPSQRKPLKKSRLKASRQVKKNTTRKPKKKKPKAKRKTALKRKAVRKALAPKAKKASPAAHKPTERLERVGAITHYFTRIQVIVIKVAKGPLKVGDTVLVKGAHTQFKQRVDSIQIESVNVPSARKGQVIGMKVGQEARVGDQLYKVLS